MKKVLARLNFKKPVKGFVLRQVTPRCIGPGKALFSPCVSLVHSHVKWVNSNKK